MTKIIILTSKRHGCVRGEEERDERALLCALPAELSWTLRLQQQNLLTNISLITALIITDRKYIH